MPEDDSKPRKKPLKRPTKSFKEMTGADYMAYLDSQGF